MRPTLDEHLMGIERALELEVAPYLQGYPSEALRRATADIRRFRRSWRNVESFLRWDNDAVRVILRRYGEAAGTAKLDRDDCRSLDEPNGLETYDELTDRNVELRRLLASVAVKIERGQDGEVRRQLLSYLAERSVRLERLAEWAGSLSITFDGADEVSLPS